MKYSFFFVACLFLSSTLKSQTHLAQKALCKECAYSINIKEISQDKKLDSLVYYYFNEGTKTWNTVLKASYIYNVEKKLATEKLVYLKTRFDSYFDAENGGLPGKSEHTYKYDKNGNVIEDLFQYSDSVEGYKLDYFNIPYIEFLSIIPKRPLPKGKNVFEEVDSVYYILAHKAVGGYKALCTYDSKNNLTSLEFLSKENNNYINYSKVVNTYDEKKNLIQEEISFIDSAKTNWLLYYRTKFSYNSKGYKTSELIDRMYDADGIKFEKIVPKQINYEYDLEGKIVKIIYKQSFENVWEDYKQIIINKNAKADTLINFTQAADGGVWYNSNRSVSILNKKGHIIKTEMQQPNYEEWEPVRKFEYTYDEKDNKITCLEEPIKSEEYKSSFKTHYYYSKK